MISRRDFTPICTIHRVLMKKSVGWYGVKYECQQCLSEFITPNGGPR